MQRIRFQLTAILTAATLLLASAATAAQAPIRVMILDGESTQYHDWKATTPVLRWMLEETGVFAVDVVTTPPPGADFTTFRPDFQRYSAVVLNYDAPDGRWPRELQESFERYIRGGGGLVIVHAADNAFPGWSAFNEMAGVGGWRGRDGRAGPHWFLDEQGALVSDASPGRAGSHGQRLPFLIDVRAEHPITAGLPRSWMHAGDELYANLRGPGRNMTVLASAWSDPANMGTGRHEPQLMVISWGQGRVFHTTLGHDLPALSSVGFIVTFQRGTEWAATGGVRQKVPPDFPSPTEVRLRELPAPARPAASVRGQP
jgi:hypothetical protein